MAKVLVLYYGAYGHIETLAQAEAEGARSLAGTEVALKRVPELLTTEQAKARYQRTEFVAPEAKPEELKEYDAVIFGSATRYGMMAGSMRHFLDQTGMLWATGAMVGKVGSVFSSANTQHGGAEPAILSFQVTLQHLGMVIVGVPYSCAGISEMDEIAGGSPYGATSVAGTQAKPRQVSKVELEIAKFQGHHVAEITAALVRGRAAK